MAIDQKILRKALGEIVIWCLIIFSFLAILAVFSIPIFQSRVPSELYPKTYFGLVLKKSLVIGETQFGSVITYYLTIECDNKIPIRVGVDEDIYKRAEIGMYIKKSERDIELSAAISENSSK